MKREDKSHLKVFLIFVSLMIFCWFFSDWFQDRIVDQYSSEKKSELYYLDASAKELGYLMALLEIKRAVNEKGEIRGMEYIHISLVIDSLADDANHRFDSLNLEYEKFYPK